MGLSDAPLRQKVSDALKEFSIIYFKDTKLPTDVEPHYYLNIPVDDNSCILLCIITSQIDGQKTHYKRVNNIKAIDSLITVNEKIIKCLKMECCIECNQAELISISDFKSRIDATVPLRVKAYQEDIPDKIKDKVIWAIKNSPRVKRYIQELL